MNYFENLARQFPQEDLHGLTEQQLVWLKRLLVLLSDLAGEQSFEAATRVGLLGTRLYLEQLQQQAYLDPDAIEDSRRHIRQVRRLAAECGRLGEELTDDLPRAGESP